MKSHLIAFLLGLVAGIAALAVVLYFQAPQWMILEDVSALDFEQTVSGITRAAEEAGWKVPSVHRLDKSVAKEGFAVAPAAVIELCRPALAARILADEESRFVASMMPCRVAVYQRADGKAVLSRMNTELLSRLFGDLIREVMAEATAESETIFETVLRPAG